VQWDTSTDFWSTKNLIEAIITTGSAKGESVLIPCIPMIPSDYPFQFKRMQFPVKVSFAMTINKSQGQTLKFTRIDIREYCFFTWPIVCGMLLSQYAHKLNYFGTNRNYSLCSL